MKTLLLIVGIVSLSSLAQQRPAPVNEKELKQQRQHARAIALIEQVGSEAELWDDKRSAVDALATAADLLWDRNPTRSTRWLTKAWTLVDQVTESEKNPFLKEFVRQSDKAQLKSVVLKVAHSHDPKLADKFVEQIAEEQPEPKKDRGVFDDRTARSEQLLWLAQQSLDTNPQLAFNLAQRSLSDGLSFALQNLITGLRKKDVALANQLFDLSLTRFSSGSPDPSEAEVLAGYLFQPGITFSSNAAGQVMVTMNPMFKGEPAVFKSEPERAHRFLLAAYQTFFARPLPLDAQDDRQRAMKIWVFGNRNLTRYDLVAPEFSGPLKAFLTQLESKLFPEGRGDPFGTSRKQSGAPPLSEKELYESRIAALEERAEKATDPAARNTAYVEAALAVDVEDTARAKSFVDKVSDDTLRADATSFVFYRSALAQVRLNKLEKAAELATQIATPARRAIVHIAMAQNLIDDKNTTATGFDLLNEVERDLRKEEPSTNVAKILLSRVGLIAKLDRDQALVALEQSFQSINKVEDFDLKNDSAPKLGIRGFWRTESLADTPSIGFSFNNAIAPMVPAEFENLVNLTDTLKAREVRGIARLQIARLFLSPGKRK